jgi:hypothetical protein
MVDIYNLSNYFCVFRGIRLRRIRHQDTKSQRQILANSFSYQQGSLVMETVKTKKLKKFNPKSNHSCTPA